MVSAHELSTTAIGEWLNARLSLAVNINWPLTAHAMRRQSLPNSGLMSTEVMIVRV